MLIAISGSQGSGKSSVLRCLEDRGYSVIRDKTSRSVLNEWGTNLENIFSNPDMVCQFQSQLIERKWMHEVEAMHDPESIVFTERTYMDLFAYTVSHIGNKNAYTSWIDDYFKKCLSCHQHFKHVVFIRGGLFDVEHDGVRPSNNHYSSMLGYYLHNLLIENSSNLSVIDFEGIEQRADKIEQLVL